MRTGQTDKQTVSGLRLPGLLIISELLTLSSFEGGSSVHCNLTAIAAAAKGESPKFYACGTTIRRAWDDDAGVVMSQCF